MEKIVIVVINNVEINIKPNLSIKDMQKYLQEIDKDAVKLAKLINKYNSDSVMKEYLMFLELLVDSGLTKKRVEEILEAHPELQESFDKAMNPMNA